MNIFEVKNIIRSQFLLSMTEAKQKLVHRKINKKVPVTLFPIITTFIEKLVYSSFFKVFII